MKLGEILKYLFLGVILFLLYKFWNEISSFFAGGKAGQDAAKQQVVVADSVANTTVLESVLKYPLSQYDTLAQSQYDAMNFAGTDSVSLFHDLIGLQKQDLRQLYKAFGTRINNFFNIGGIFETEEQDLFAFYKEELSGVDLVNMQQLWKLSGILW